MKALWQIITLVLSLLHISSLNSTVLASAPLNLSAPDDHQVQTGFYVTNKSIFKNR